MNHTERRVPVFTRELAKLDAEQKQFIEKEKEVRRRWKLTREGLENEKAILTKRLEQIERLTKLEVVRQSRDSTRSRPSTSS